MMVMMMIQGTKTREKERKKMKRDPQTKSRELFVFPVSLLFSERKQLRRRKKGKKERE
jgi:hypothetical protein